MEKRIQPHPNSELLNKVFTVEVYPVKKIKVKKTCIIVSGML